MAERQRRQEFLTELTKYGIMREKIKKNSVHSACQAEALWRRLVHSLADPSVGSGRLRDFVVNTSSVSSN